MLSDFRNRVAVITGAASGIGKALAEALLVEGANVVLADVDASALEHTANEFRHSGYEPLTVQTDVSQPAQLERLAVQSFRQFGKVDILCNNAAVTPGGPSTWENSLEDWEWVLGINLMGVVHGIKSFVPRMIKQGTPGVVLNTSSILGLTLGSTNAAYPVSKHGVVVLSECLSNEFRRQKVPISVHVLCPSFVATNILKSTSELPSSAGDTNRKPVSEQTETYNEWFARQHNRGMSPQDAAELTLDAIRAGRFYILTHPAMKRLVEHRMQAILNDREPSDDEFLKQHALDLGFESAPPPRPDEVME